MIYVEPGATFTAIAEGFSTGLAGTIGVRIENGDGTNHTARTTAGIVEVEAASGTYAKANLVAPEAAGTYIVLWDSGGGSPTFASEELVITYDVPVSPGPGGFTYLGTLATDLDKVRFEVGDTESANPLFTDAEVNGTLSAQGNNMLLTAAHLCEVLATRFARQYDFAEDGQSFKRGSVSKMYADRAQALRERASGGINTLPASRIDGYSQDEIRLEDTDASSRTGRVRAGYFHPDLPD